MFLLSQGDVIHLDRLKNLQPEFRSSRLRIEDLILYRTENTEA